jgi:DNA-binding NarL/FixJ family response regulator
MTIRLLLVDDQLLFRQGLASLLSLESDLEIIGQASNGQEAIAIAEQLQPDVILMDIQMPICDGIEATQVIHQRYPGIKILILSTFDDDDYICRSLQAGALGYLLKDTTATQIANAIRTVSQDHSQLSPTVAKKVFAKLSTPQSNVNQPLYYLDLNQREQVVLQHLAEGKTNREIAQILHLSEGTIKNYVTKILRVLGLRDRTQVAIWVKQQRSQ